MSHLPRSFHILIPAVFALLPAVPMARADINGFGDFSGFAVNVADSGSAPSASGNSIHLTSGGDESRSIFSVTPQTITAFSASFTYQELNGNTNSGPLGGCFVIQNSAAQAHTVASTFEGGGFQNYGYGDFFGNFDHSAAVSIEGHPGSASTMYSGFYTDGSGIGNGALATSPVSIFAGDPINVTISYNGSSLQESLTDTITSAGYQTTYLGVHLPAIVGSSTAYVGFTAGNEGSADQYVSNFTFTTVPEPSSWILFGAGTLGLFTQLGRKRV